MEAQKTETFFNDALTMEPGFMESREEMVPLMKPKRQQVKNACTNCQKACKKCDDGRPCGRCIKYGLSDTCVNSMRKERKKSGKRSSIKRADSFSDAGSSSATKRRGSNRKRSGVVSDEEESDFDDALLEEDQPKQPNRRSLSTTFSRAKMDSDIISPSFSSIFKGIRSHSYTASPPPSRPSTPIERSVSLDLLSELCSAELLNSPTSIKLGDETEDDDIMIVVEKLFSPSPAPLS